MADNSTTTRLGVPPLRFTKMHGIGNDYIYVDCFEEGEDHDWPRLSREISDRHYGVGSDGLILVMKSTVADFRMRMFNSDGSEGDMCGNGIRSFSKLVYERGKTKATEFTVETLAGIMRPRLSVKEGIVQSIRVNMGRPSFRPADVPMVCDVESAYAVDIPVSVGGRNYLVTGVRMGNPNAVIFVDDLDAVNLAVEGRLLECHPSFPRKANIEFTKVIDREHVEMKVWERGSGITLACGTGASACAVAAAFTGRTGRNVRVTLPGGTLDIEWSQDGEVYMTGPAEEICTGVFTKWRENAPDSH